MEDDDIIELISEMVHECHDSKYEDMDSIYRRTKELHTEIVDIVSTLHIKMGNIEKMINEHAIGVQNVYNKVKGLID